MCCQRLVVGSWQPVRLCGAHVYSTRRIAGAVNFRDGAARLAGATVRLGLSMETAYDGKLN